MSEGSSIIMARHLGDATERWAHRSKPPEHKPHNQRATTGGKAKWQTADLDGQQADQSSHKNAEADEYDVRFTRRPFDIAQDLAYTLPGAVWRPLCERRRHAAQSSPT